MPVSEEGTLVNPFAPRDGGASGVTRSAAIRAQEPHACTSRTRDRLIKLRGDTDNGVSKPPVGIALKKQQRPVRIHSCGLVNDKRPG